MGFSVASLPESICDRSVSLSSVRNCHVLPDLLRDICSKMTAILPRPSFDVNPTGGLHHPTLCRVMRYLQYRLLYMFLYAPQGVLQTLRE